MAPFIHAGTHGRDVAHRHYKNLHAEHVVKNQAYAIITESLPARMKKPLLNDQGDAVFDLTGSTHIGSDGFAQAAFPAFGQRPVRVHRAGVGRGNASNGDGKAGAIRGARGVAEPNGRTAMTVSPTIFGNGGHQAAGDIYRTNPYSNVGLGRSAMMGGLGNPFQDEPPVRQKIRLDGTVSDLIWGLDTAFNTSTLTFRLRQNSSDTTLAVSFGPTVTGWQNDHTHSISVSSGDWLNFVGEVGLGNGNYSGSFNCASMRFTGATDSAQLVAIVGLAGTPNFTSDQYVSFLGIIGFGVTDENLAKYYATAAGTWEFLACHVASSTFNASTTIHSRLPGGSGMVDGNMTITIPASVSSPGSNFEDTTHVDSVNAGDFLDYRFSSSSTTGHLRMDWVGCHYFPATGSNCMIGGTPQSTMNIPFGDVYYSPLFGGGSASPTETRATGAFPYAATVKDYANYIVSGTGTCTLMLNSVASLLAVTSSTLLTGWLIDSSHTAGVLELETCANRIYASDTSLEWNGAGLLVVAA